MRRLFSTFAHGAPGIGLLVMRLIAGITLLIPGIAALRGELISRAAVLAIFEAGAGLLLIAGLWDVQLSTF